MQTEPDARLDEPAGDAPSAVYPDTTGLSVLFALLRAEPVWALLLTGGLILPVLMFVQVPLIRIPLGIGLVLFVPGYTLVRALLGNRVESRGMYAAGLGFGVSLAILPFIALGLEITGLGIHPVQALITLAGWICFWTLVGFGRRYVQVLENGPNFAKSSPDTPSHGRANVVPLMALGASAVLLLTILMASIGDSERLETEFYVLGETGQARDYPYTVGTGRLASVTVGITNHGEESHSYAVDVVEIGKEGAADRLLANFEPRELPAEETLERQLFWRMDEPGRERTVRIELYRDGVREPHRSLVLKVDVLNPSEWDDETRTTVPSGLLPE